MRKESGITMIALVVTIVILIILAGISINLTLGEDGLITKAKQAKENMELAQIEEQTHLNELYSSFNSQLGTSGDISYDAIAKLAEFKKQIADYIGEAGGIKPEYTAETTTFGDSIKGIVKEVTKNATATAGDILQGKTAYVNGQLLTGELTSSSSDPSLLINTSEANTGYTYTLTKDSKILLIATATRAVGFVAATTIYYPTITITLNDETLTCENATSYHLSYRGLYASAPSYDTAGTRTRFKIIDAKKDDVIKFTTNFGKLSVIIYEI